MSMNETNINNFIMRVLTATTHNNSDLFWKTNLEHHSITFFINCNDVFYWACSDVVEITEDNIEIFEQSYKDYEEYGGILFCCRVRNMRPQGAFYQYFADDKKYLFDDCGPKRNIDILNPYNEYGEYLYKPEDE